MTGKIFLFLILINLAAPVKGQPGLQQSLQPWPRSGPPVLFEISGLGYGYSSPAVANNRLFVTGEIDSTGYLFAYDLKGNFLWKTNYGSEFTVSFRGTRADPVVVDSLVYICSGTGQIACFKSETGAKIWSVDMVEDLGGEIPTFGYSMFPLPDGDIIYCSPGGEKNNVVALNRFTGELVWSSPAKGETAGYGDPIIISLSSRKLLITASEGFIMVFDVTNGALLWSYQLNFKGEIPCNRPVFDGTNLYWTSGPGNGAVAVRLSPDSNEIKLLWKNMDFDTYFGDIIRINNYLYGHSAAMRKYVSVDTGTGNIKNSLPFGTGSTIAAENMLIAYNQNGQIGLIKPDEGKLELISSFKITKGTKEHFSHPVYADGKLFIRHGKVLMAFKLVENH